MVATARRRKFFVRRQVITTLGLLASALITRFLLGAAAFPEGYVLLFALATITAAFLLALLLAASAPLAAYSALYLLTGAAISAHRIALDGALVHISPDGRRALYAGVFGASNLGSALLPLVTGTLAGVLGFGTVFIAAAAAALLGLVPLRKLAFGTWYREA